LISRCLTDTTVFATVLEGSNSRFNNILQFLGARAAYACYHMPLDWIAKVV